MKDALNSLMALFIDECKKRGLRVRVTSTDRRPIEQAALYVQGRYDIMIVNAYRAAAGLVPLKPDNNVVVTKTLASKHLTGEAFDIVMGEKAHYNLKIDENAAGGPDYAEAAEIGRRVGLQPGIDFGDAPHYQLRQGGANAVV